jgi:hypothetical protein
MCFGSKLASPLMTKHHERRRGDEGDRFHLRRESFVVPALAPTTPKKEARQSCQRASIGPSMEAFMLRPAHDSRKLEPTIATIRPLKNSGRQAGVTRTPRISALS